MAVLRLPFFFEDGIDQGIPPAIFVELVFVQMGFLAHAQFFENMCRTEVISDAMAGDAVQVHFDKTEAQHDARGFGGIAVAPLFRVEFIADIAFK